MYFLRHKQIIPQIEPTNNIFHNLSSNTTTFVSNPASMTTTMESALALAPRFTRKGCSSYACNGYSRWPVSAAFLSLFGLLLILHIGWGIKYKSKLSLLIIFAALLETLGYALKLATNWSYDIHLHVVWMVLVMSAPFCMFLLSYLEPFNFNVLIYCSCKRIHPPHSLPATRPLPPHYAPTPHRPSVAPNPPIPRHPPLPPPTPRPPNVPRLPPRRRLPHHHHRFHPPLHLFHPPTPASTHLLRLPGSIHS